MKKPLVELGRVATLGLVFTALLSAAAAAATPVKSGGTLTIGLAAEPDVLDPALGRTFYGRVIFMHMCDKLYDIDGKGRIVPQIATALPTVSKDKLTYTIKIRSGLKFNDGTPLNADAVKQSLNRMLTLPGSQRLSEIGGIKSIDTSGATTVILHVAEPFSPLTAQLADRAGMITSPTAVAKLGSNFGTAPVCSGPFMFKERVANDHITLTKSPYYWDKAHIHLSSIVFKIMPDANSRIQALLAGDIQVAQGLQSGTVAPLLTNKKVSLVKATILASNNLVINIGNSSGLLKTYTNVGTPLAKSAALRRAFSLAIDRTTLNNVAFGGRSTPGCFPLPPSSEWYAGMTKGLPCNLHADIAGAKKLIASSGYQTPIPVKLLAYSADTRMAQVIQSMVEKVGFQVDIELNDFTTVLNRGTAGTFGVWEFVASSGRVDPDYPFVTSLGTKGAFNLGGYSNPQLDYTMGLARKSVTQVARATIYRAALKIVRDEMPVIYLGYPTDYTAVTKSVSGITEYGDGIVRARTAGFVK